jgi:hypothetical protein
MQRPQVKVRIACVRWTGATVLLVAVAATATACGGGASSGPAGSTAAAPPPARLALASAPKRRGEVLVRADASPASHGPFALDGRYVARFEQVAPEDPELDFRGQTAFVVTADRKPQQAGAGTVRLFRAAARTGRRTVTLRGRLYLDVAFGDFPYAIRLTPVGRR